MSKKDNTMALIKVQGGHLTEEQIVAHLQRLISGAHEWDVQLQSPDTWTVPFPSKTELTRTFNYGAADLKNGMFLKFKEFDDEENFG